MRVRKTWWLNLNSRKSINWKWWAELMDPDALGLQPQDEMALPLLDSITLWDADLATRLTAVRHGWRQHFEVHWTTDLGGLVPGGGRRFFHSRLHSTIRYRPYNEIICMALGAWCLNLFACVVAAAEEKIRCKKCLLYKHDTNDFHLFPHSCADFLLRTLRFLSTISRRLALLNGGETINPLSTVFWPL